ncbi:hypothetical protein GYMLUDRAFT_37018 [Collybiopsis luxurians FD-317 M1]|nr:hypothetical protein GYMLUDRAFT_37018 [Collybiopsis luxurians FD-317 M1]
MDSSRIIDLTVSSSDSEDDIQLISHSRKRKMSRRAHSNKKFRSATPPDDLFIVDIQPAADCPVHDLPRKRDSNEGKLLLPPHVSVMGSVPVEIIAPVSEDQDYVEYLDYGGPDELGFSRYFQTESDRNKAPSVVVCKKCGAKGEHKTSACPVIICLTCGVRNEHSTNSCPISKVCFACGMKGHLNATCPNRGKLANTYNDCERCGSMIHTTSECPTHWRIYTYASDADRVRTLEIRKSKKAIPLGQGGEGYIAEDIWCYNCGESGHWGDDCEVMPHVHDIPDGFSAFGNNNLFTGPFSEIQSGTTERAPREWEIGSSEWNDWNGRVPTNVGRQGKKKEIARMRARQAEDEDDRFTFLAKPMRQNDKPNSEITNKPPSQPKKMRLEINIKGAAKMGSALANKPNFGKMNSDMASMKSSLQSKEAGTLLSRMSTDPGFAKSSGRLQEDDKHRKDGAGHLGKDRERNGHRERNRQGDHKHSSKEKNRGSDNHRRERGPRYKGGYSNHQ